MKHLNSKILAMIVACSAAMLMNVNVHAATNQAQQQTTKRPQTTQMNNNRHEVKSSSVVMPKNQVSHHYTYQNLRTVKNNQNALIRLGSRRGHRSNKQSVKKPNNKQNNQKRQNTKRPVNRQNQKNRRQNKQNNPRVTRQNRNNRNNKNKRNVRKPRAKKRRTVKYQAPKLARFHEKIINQKKSAVNHYSKKIKYVENDQPANFQSSGQYGDPDYARTGTPITGTTQNGSTITFHRVTFIPKKLNNKRIMNQFYSPQGLVIVGHYAYVITNATNSYESSHNNDSDKDKQTPASYINGDNSTGTSAFKKPGATQIIRIDLSKHVKDYNENLKAAHRNIKVGPVFYGGHGQGFAYNSKTGQLWLLNNITGQRTKTAVSLINPRTLLPELRINFHFGNTTIGDDLAFDRKGNAYSVTEAGNGSFATPGALKFFAGLINNRGIHMKLIEQALRYAPSDVIQGLTYNPKNNRLYILGDESVTSVPVKYLGHLKTSDVWNTQFNTTREFEGLSFDRFGNGYLLVSRSPEILRANYNRHLQF
ncbi:hypothetical protein [Acetilactobacillus jinshanensis]|uniref:Extracellular protein n=1 Tax=Acetilactobacillus jinshanensis TaxID=1720083 RepID=A0A4P6ZJ36_9LACO|nr:hypothetical protein [Acetilactobacillus jinshanensis]QBP17735.1 hypothetical protein ELX58_00775 [Acetilactobacillus jinshanensis]URL60597.1 hypothetical protein HGK75_00785 [uncultured bacterium]